MILPPVWLPQGLANQQKARGCEPDRQEEGVPVRGFPIMGASRYE